MTSPINVHLGNERLQEMMGIMARERGSEVFATDERCENDHLAFWN